MTSGCLSARVRWLFSRRRAKDSAAPEAPRSAQLADTSSDKRSESVRRDLICPSTHTAVLIGSIAAARAPSIAFPQLAPRRLRLLLACRTILPISIPQQSSQWLPCRTSLDHTATNGRKAMTRMTTLRSEEFKIMSRHRQFHCQSERLVPHRQCERMFRQGHPDPMILSHLQQLAIRFPGYHQLGRMSPTHRQS